MKGKLVSHENSKANGGDVTVELPVAPHSGQTFGLQGAGTESKTLKFSCKHDSPIEPTSSSAP